MERIIFINGVYHSQFFISDALAFLDSFCLNNGFEPSEVQMYLPLTEEQSSLIDSYVDNGDHLQLKNGQAIIVGMDNGEEVVKHTINLTPA